MKPQKILIAKAISRKKNKSRGSTKPGIRIHYKTMITKQHNFGIKMCNRPIKEKKNTEISLCT